MDSNFGRVRTAPAESGLEDNEYLWALGRKRGDPWSARADCEPVTTSLTACTHVPAVLLAARERIARELSDGAGGSPGTSKAYDCRIKLKPKERP